MLWPLDETLKLIKPHVPYQLVSFKVFSWVKGITTRLPKAASSYYWECRLAAGATQVDFLACVAASDGGREVLAGQGTGAGLPDVLLENPLWDPAHDFFRQWAEPTSVLHEAIPLIWLEFDQVDGPVPEVPLPSFSFCLDPLYADRRSWSQHINSLNMQERRKVAERGVHLFFGSPLSPQSQQALFACFDSLPPSGQIIHLSAMVARQPAVVKMYGSIPKDQLLTYLTRIGWPGSIPELTDILTTFCTPETVDNNMFIDLTVGETVMPKLGLAFSQLQIENLPHRDPTRQILLDQCVQTGLCTPEKRDALLTWPGSFRATFRHEQWPTRFRKWLDVKIIYQPNQPLEAKGYLGFMPYFSLF
jgi:hypothetical protein